MNPLINRCFVMPFPIVGACPIALDSDIFLLPGLGEIGIVVKLAIW
jgi:hypothetical protein